MDNFRRDRFHLIDERTDERILAEQICDSRNPARVLVNGFHCLWRKDRGSISSADAQPFVYISGHLFKGKGLRSAAHRDALAQLTQSRIAEFFLQLGLAGKNDLQELFVCCLEISEQTNFLQHFKGKVLRLIHDQDRGLTITIALHQPMVEAHQYMAFIAALTWDAEVRHHKVKELAGVELRIKDVGSRDAF